MSTRRDRPSAPIGKRSALAELDSTETAAVLDDLLRLRPELREEAERVAREHLIDTDVERVAEAVAWELQHLSSDELVGRAPENSVGDTSSPPRRLGSCSRRRWVRSIARWSGCSSSR